MVDSESEIVKRHVNRAAKVEIAPLVEAHRKDLVGEHRERPFGPHGDHLYRVLTFLRRIETDPRYVVVMTEPHHEWTLGRLPAGRGKTPELLDDARYDTQEAAEHAVFLRRLAAFEDRFCGASTETEKQ